MCFMRSFSFPSPTVILMRIGKVGFEADGFIEFGSGAVMKEGKTVYCKDERAAGLAPVPSKLIIYVLLDLLTVCNPYVFAAEIAVCFTPEYEMTPSCTQEVVDALAGAKKRVLVQAYKGTRQIDVEYPLTKRC